MEEKKGVGRPKLGEKNHKTLPPHTPQPKKNRKDRLPDPQSMITSQGLVRSKLSRKEQNVLKGFLEHGDRVRAFKEVYKDYEGSDRSIYRWYQRSYISSELFSISQSLKVYDTYIDNQIVQMITSPETTTKDRISLIQMWNELRKRIDNSVKVDHTINFSNINDQTLTSIFDKIFTYESTAELDYEEVDYSDSEDDNDDSDDTDDNDDTEESDLF